MRLLILCLLPILANAAQPQAVRTISAAASSAATPPPVCATAGGRPTEVIRSISTGTDHIVSTVAAGTCLATAPADPNATYPAAGATIHHAHGQRRPLPEDSAQTRACVANAAHVFGIEKSALYLILDVEAGTVGQTSAPNTDGSHDIGPMQVNSWWLPRLAAQGITRSDLQNDLCVNILAGAWIYAQERSDSKTVAEAIARYHSHTPAHQRTYLNLIEKAIDRRLFLAKNELDKKGSPCLTPSPTCSISSTSSNASSPSPPPSTPTSSGT